jgi:hypothetical protein
MVAKIKYALVVSAVMTFVNGAAVDPSNFDAEFRNFAADCKIPDWIRAEFHDGESICFMKKKKRG